MLLIVCCAMAIGSGTASATTKSFNFSHVRITAIVSPDGSMDISEDRTYHFVGSFSRAFVDLTTSARWDYTNISVSEDEQQYRLATEADRDPIRTPNTFHVDPSNGALRVTWYHRSSNQDRTFTLRYRVQRAVVQWDDTAELYWQFIGSGWDVDSNDVSVSIALPPPGATFPQMKVFAHGPLSGEIHALDATHIQATAPIVPPRTFLEVRALFPSSLVPEAPRSSGARLTDAGKEEAGFAKQANARRARAKALEILGLIVGVALGIFAIAMAMVLFFRYGKEYDIDVGDYVREIPQDYPPAVAGLIFRFGRTTVDDITATFMDLARRGYLRITQTTEDHLFRDKKIHLFERVKPVDGSLADFESMLITWAFETVGEDGKVTDTDMSSYVKSHSSFATWFGEFKASVKTRADAEDWIEKKSTAMMILNFLVGALVALAGVGLIVLGAKDPQGIHILGGVAALIGGAIQLGISPTIKRRSKKGATQFAEWNALRRFLLDFSEMKHATVEALTMWESYLVYAVVLGVADEVVKTMQKLSPEYQRTNGRGLYPLWFYSASGSMAPDLGALSSSFNSFSAAAHSSMSSSSGSGGGFSGGGGRGGGGGGGGAD
ncbi:MAG: DUF2207 domain-containing protein [Actinobacteria bacterium]|nr:DUF2207 domain-containing protein [Actinomycetota bacterium]